jgi:sulfur-carrier protein
VTLDGLKSAGEPGPTPKSPEVIVILPRPLLALFPEARAEVWVTADTIEGMIGVLDQLWPGMKVCLCDETPRIRQHLAIFCDGERAALDSVLAQDAKIYILTAMSGG